MAGYLQSRYQDTYRLKCPYDLRTNQYPRKLNDTYEDADVYIDCSNDIKIFYYGKGILEVYIPSLGRGRNVIRQIYYQYINPSNVETRQTENTVANGVSATRTSYNIIDKDIFTRDTGKDDCIIFDIHESDEEVMFKFKVKYDKEIIPLLKPKTSGASISPFSSKNLPKNREFKIEDDDLLAYKNIVARIPKERILDITHITNRFMKSLVTKRNTWDMIKADMQLKGLKGKEYIYCIGKWNEYIDYLDSELK